MRRKIPRPEKPFLTGPEIAGLLHVSRMTVYRWMKSGQLKTFRAHTGKYRVLKPDFDEFLSQSGMKRFVEASRILRPTTKILIIDDDSAVVKAIKTFLAKSSPDFHIVEASNGFEAGRLLHRFNPDVVILDLRMPGRDGFTVCRQIKSDPLAAHARVVVVTGYATDDNVKKIKKEGADAVFAKPFDYHELLKTIERLTGKT